MAFVDSSFQLARLQDRRASERERKVDEGLKQAISGFQQIENQKRQQEALERQEALRQEQLQRDAVQMGIQAQRAGLDPSAVVGAAFGPQFAQVQQPAGFMGPPAPGGFGGFAGVFEKRPDVLAREAEAKQLKAEERAFKRQDQKLRIEKNRQDIAAKRERLALDKRKFGETSKIKREELAIKRQEAKAKQQKLAYEKTPQGRLEKLGGEARNKVGSIASGFRALSGMKEAISQGFGPRRLNPDTALLGQFIPDDPFSENQRMLDEVVGRLQSGGAINTEELKSFRAMGPRPGEKGPTAARKLESQMKFLENKLTAFGFKRDELRELNFDIGQDDPSQQQMQQQANQAIANAGLVPSQVGQALPPLQPVNTQLPFVNQAQANQIAPNPQDANKSNEDLLRELQAIEGK